MKKIIKGVQQFQRDSFRARHSLFQKLASGQQPIALFITCSDSRIDPNLLTHTEPGELFVLRNAGNIVPPYGSVRGGEAATIEYAVNVLKVEDIIICGHSHCGAMAGRLAPESLGGLPAVRDWLIHAEDPPAGVPQGFGRGADDDSDPLIRAVQKNVCVQLEHLRTHPAVATALARNELNPHGWVYQSETGKVSTVDPAKERFVPIEATAG